MSICYDAKNPRIPTGAFVPLYVCVCVSVCVCVWLKTQIHSALSEFGNKISSCIGGHHYKLCMRGLGAPWPLLQTHTQHGRLDYDH